VRPGPISTIAAPSAPAGSGHAPRHADGNDDSRRGHGKAIVAAARKLVVLFWCMLTRGQDYAHQQPSLTAQKLRRLELTAGAPVRNGKPSGVWVTHQKMRHAEKQLAARAQASYERTACSLTRHRLAPEDN
jgi:hypothetical protein